MGKRRYGQLIDFFTKVLHRNSTLLLKRLVQKKKINGNNRSNPENETLGLTEFDLSIHETVVFSSHCYYVAFIADKTFPSSVKSMFQRSFW